MLFRNKLVLKKNSTRKRNRIETNWNPFFKRSATERRQKLSTKGTNPCMHRCGFLWNFSASFTCLENGKLFIKSQSTFSYYKKECSVNYHFLNHLCNPNDESITFLVCLPWTKKEWLKYWVVIIRGVNYSYEGRMGFGIFWDFFGIFGIFWDFSGLFPIKCTGFFIVFYPS